MLNTDATGAGGGVIGTPATFTSGSMTEVPLTGGAGVAVYEVIDANNNIQENAHRSRPSSVSPLNTAARDSHGKTVSFAPPPSTPCQTAAAEGLPVPRFAATTPPSDCPVIGDCGANYFPKLSATTTGLQFIVSGTSNLLTQFIQVNNISGGTLDFAATVTYQETAQGWLTITNQSGNPNHTTLRVDAQPIGLVQGAYQATFTINAGAAGTQTFPATFTIGPGQIIISSVLNAASLQAGPLVAGSLATVKGTNLSGKSVSVTFGGIAGTLLYNSAQQINVQVPASLASNSSTQVVVTVDGNSSAPLTVQLATDQPRHFSAC